MRESRKSFLSATAVSLLLAAGCVSSPDTRLASSQYTVALDSYAQNVAAFEAAWVAEIDRLIGDLGDALMARAVAGRIRTLSARYDDFTGDSWRQEVAGSGLVTLSAAVDDERDRVRNVLRRISAIDRPASALPDQAVRHVLDTYRDQTIMAVTNNPVLDEAERERLIAEAGLGPFGNDRVANAIVETIITWQLVRDAVPRDLDNLYTVLSALRTAHASVDRWIQTDVTVPGEDVAALVNAWSAALGESQ